MSRVVSVPALKARIAGSIPAIAAMSTSAQFTDALVADYIARGEPMSNLFTKYFQGRGLKQMREDEEQKMAAAPDDNAAYGASDGPYRASDPQPGEMKWVTYEKSGSRSSWLLTFTQKLGKFLVAWLILLYTANCSRPMYDAPIRLYQCIAMLCLVWCITYVRFKKVPV